MTNPIEVLVPDIGGFNDVNVTDSLPVFVTVTV